MIKLNEMNQKFIMPAHARMLTLDQVPDYMFKQRLLGDGFALDLIDGEIVAPMDCTITALFPTGHAIGLLLNDTVELLMHIGIDTIRLKNKPIEIMIELNQKVKQGQTLVRVDLKKFKEGNVPTIVSIVFTRNTLFSIKSNVSEVQCKEENIVQLYE